MQNLDRSIPEGSHIREAGLRRVPVVLLGIGGVGRALLRQILEHREFYARRFKLSLDVILIVDSHGILRAGPADFLGDSVLKEVIDLKQSGGSLLNRGKGDARLELTDLISDSVERGTIVVDCTASSETASALLMCLQRGGKIVLSNKKPLTEGQDQFRALTADPASVRWETTVSSNLPVISALNRIIASGDEVLRITGAFSGTLGFLMTRLQEGAGFSRVIRQAVAAGFTEPDPREDLSGTDVARKSLILARGIGWEMGMQDIEVRGLVPGNLSGHSVEEFLEQISELDTYFSVRVRASRKHGNALRYVAVIENGGCRVGPLEVALETPLGRLRGNDNLAEIHTRVFDPNPLVVQGRGGGVRATASGVLSDIVELAFTR